MRQHDIVILLKIISFDSKAWQLKDLASTLFISASEVSESLNRSKIAGLIDFNKQRINRQSLVEFIEHGFKYVFPQQPGSMTNGIPTAHAHPFLKKYIKSELPYIWPDAQGSDRGLIIEPLYPNQVKAVKDDQTLYKLLALLDVFRVGRVREIKVASQEIRKMILNEPS